MFIKCYITSNTIYYWLILFSVANVMVSCQRVDSYEDLSSTEYEVNDTDVIMNSMIEEAIIENKADNISIDAFLYNQNPDGSWSDIDYTSTEVAIWEPRFHLDRIKALLFEYLDRNSAYFKNINVIKPIQRGLDFWRKANAKSDNWWWGVIGEPQRVGMILMLIKKSGIDISEQNIGFLLQRIPSTNPYRYTGANRSDVARANIYKALYSCDEKMLKESYECLYSSIEYGSNYSFQKDKSYFEGDAQLYVGGYSEVLIENVLKIAKHAQNTSFSIPADRLLVISDYLRYCLQGTIRGNVMAFNCHGRSVTRENHLDESYFAPTIDIMSSLDSTNQRELMDFAARLRNEKPASYGVPNRHLYCYKADFTIHNNPKGNFVVRTLSKRTMRDEMDNNENLKGYYICDGSTSINRNGQEYYDIMPLWDWKYIPGTTISDMPNIPIPFYGQKGTADFCGGVSDSISGVTSVSYFDNYKSIDTGANKSYFFFDDIMVCLGSNISTAGGGHTTIDQSWAANVLQLKRGNKVEFLGGGGAHEQLGPEVKWCLHNGIGYVFLEQISGGGHNLSE